MSTRYVYELYNTEVEKEYVESKVVSSLNSSFTITIRAWLCNEFEPEVKLDMQGNEIAKYSPIGEVFDVPQENGSSSAKEHYLYKYCIINSWHPVTDGESRYIESYLISLDSNSPKLFWHTNVTGNYPRETFTIWNSNASSAISPGYDGTEKGVLGVEGGKLEKGGTLLNTQTANSKTQEVGAFYSDGWKWRSYKGADTIDPSALAYSKTELEAGDTVLVSVSPRRPTYGGTIYYRYQYSINGGATWISAGSRTTETSKTITIPEGAEQFRARVQASDGWGFTSTTYVTGENLLVSQIKAYATVDGKLQAGVKMYAAIGGKIRQVQKGYVTVGGKARKIF